MMQTNNWPHWRAELFDIRKVPFSRACSFLAISILDDGHLWLRSVRGGDEHTDDGKLLRLEMHDANGNVTPYRSVLEPDCLQLINDDGCLEICFVNGETIVLRGHHAGLRLSMQPKAYDYVQVLDASQLRISHARQDLGIQLRMQEGVVTVDAPWQGMRAERIQLDFSPQNDLLQLELHVYRVVPQAPVFHDFESVRQKCRADFLAWEQTTLAGEKEHQEGRLLASYITWSCIVPKGDLLSENAMYMSKNWMTNIWSWDHCFNTLALAKNQPEIAWQQMKILFDQQHTTGRLPDFVNDRFAYWRFTKPPVHGWTFAQLRKAAPDFYTQSYCQQMIAWLSLQVESWMTNAIAGLPCYDHGNDAGWDNSTIFLEGTPLCSPDLATFLILQMREIAALHLHLNNTGLAEEWRLKAHYLQSELIAQLWSGETFFAKHGIQQKAIMRGNSLIRFMPLLLGQDLPIAIRSKLIDDLQTDGKFITQYGAATESIDSIFYQPDGYWRGPIWAPVMALLCDALGRCNEPSLATSLAKRFTSMANHAGMAENFDATTGKGLRDPAFTWTSSVFLLLSHQIAVNSSLDSPSNAVRI